MKIEKNVFLGSAFLVLLSLLSCVDEKNYSQETPQKGVEDYFDFSTKKSVQLNVNYGFVGLTALIEVYAENPLVNECVRKEGLKPVFEVFTDQNCSFSGLVDGVPAYADTLFIYSPTKGNTKYLKLPIVNGVATYDFNSVYPATKAKTVGMGEEHIHVGKYYRQITNQYPFYSLYTNYTSLMATPFRAYNAYFSELYSVVKPNEKLSEESTMGQLLNRIDNALTKVDNSKFVSNEQLVNLSIADKDPDGNPVLGARLDLVLLENNGGYHSAMAYYYYKTGTNPTAAQIKALKKYFVIPRMTDGKPDRAVKTRLQFFGEAGDEPGTDVFPAGYTVGWMIISNTFPESYISVYTALPSIEEHNIEAFKAGKAIYSNQSANYKQQPGCITLYDKKSQKIVIGFEDQSYEDLSLSDKSYEDVLFYVDADPIGAVIDVDRPEIPVVDEDVWVTERTVGTFAFEDVWPSGGDYDMNDVVVEYESAVTFNQRNEISKIVDTFKPVNKINSAINSNAFGYVIDGPVGEINVAESNFYQKEEGNQFILFPNARVIAEEGKVFKVTREFKSPIDKASYRRNNNPFVVVNYKEGMKLRKEVHLPKMKPTSWADTSLVGTGDDAYYIDKEGAFPFAIDIPVVGLEIVTEGESIGQPEEYPYFAEWAKSYGKKHADWYKVKR